MTAFYLESLSSQLIRLIKDYPYPDYFLHTAVGFSSSILLKAKEKNMN